MSCCQTKAMQSQIPNASKHRLASNFFGGIKIKQTQS